LRRLPAKNDAPLIIDANAIKALQITPQGFETVTGRGAQIVKRMSRIEAIQFLQCRFHNRGWKTSDSVTPKAMEEIFRRTVAK
jgi:hypothetical protein